MKNKRSILKNNNQITPPSVENEFGKMGNKYSAITQVIQILENWKDGKVGVQTHLLSPGTEAIICTFYMLIIHKPYFFFIYFYYGYYVWVRLESNKSDHKWSWVVALNGTFLRWAWIGVVFERSKLFSFWANPRGLII